MTWFPFRRQAAWDRTGASVNSGVGQVYAITDTTFATPLVARGVSGGATIPTVAIEDFLSVEFEVEGHEEVYWKSGGLPPVHLISAVGMRDDARASRAAAETAQAAAETAAAAAYGPADATVAAVVAAVGSASRAAVQDAIGVTAAKRAVSMSRVPGFASGIVAFNGAAFTQDNVTTFNGKHYAVWWNEARKPIVGVKTLPDGAWATFDLSTVAGNPLASPGDIDGHNVLVIAADAAGYLHVWGNEHGNAMRYARSNAPEAITAWTAKTMIGAQETSVTYPTPVKTTDGTLYFLYREGGSGNGDTYLNRYSTTTATWARVAKLFDGMVSSECAYLNRVVPGPGNTLHLFFTWRGTGNADTNNDFGYVKVNAAAGTAMKSTGAAQTVPITHANSETIIDTAATGSGIINQQGADIDAEGRPHAITWLYDGAGKTQLRHVWHDGAAWHNDQVTQLTQRIDLNVLTFQPSLSRAALVCPAQGGTFVVYRASFDGKAGSVRAIDVTPGRVTTEFKLLELETYDWEPTFDTQAARERNELVMLVIPLAGNYTSTTSAPWNGVDSWSNQVALHTVIDLEQIDAFKAGTVQLPRLAQHFARTGPNAGVTITATTPTDFGFGVGVIDAPDALLFARLAVRATGTSGNAYVQLRRALEPPVLTTTLAPTLTLATANGYASSPWVPIPEFNVSGGRGFIGAYAYKDAAANANVSAVTLEVARLVGLTS